MVRFTKMSTLTASVSNKCTNIYLLACVCYGQIYRNVHIDSDSEQQMYGHLPIGMCLLWSDLPKCTHWQRQWATNVQIFTYWHKSVMVRFTEMSTLAASVSNKCTDIYLLTCVCYGQIYRNVHIGSVSEQKMYRHLPIGMCLLWSDLPKCPHWQRQWTKNVQIFTYWHVFIIVRFTEMSTLTASVSNRCTDIYLLACVYYGQIYRNVHIDSVSEQQMYRYLPIYIRLLWSVLPKCPHWQRQWATNVQIFTYWHVSVMVWFTEMSTLAASVSNKCTDIYLLACVCYGQIYRNVHIGSVSEQQMYRHLPIGMCLLWSDLTKCPHWQRQWATNVQIFTYWHVSVMVRFTDMSTLAASVSNKCTDIYLLACVCYGQIYRNIHIGSVSEQQMYRHLPIGMCLLWSDLPKCPHWQRQWATNVQIFTYWHVSCYGQIYRNVHIGSVSEHQMYRHLPIGMCLLWSDLPKCPHWQRQWETDEQTFTYWHVFVMVRFTEMSTLAAPVSNRWTDIYRHASAIFKGSLTVLVLHAYISDSQNAAFELL